MFPLVSPPRAHNPVLWLPAIWTVPPTASLPLPLTGAVPMDCSPIPYPTATLHRNCAKSLIAVLPNISLGFNKYLSITVKSVCSC